MGSNECIEQTGIVEEIRDNSVLVRFQSAPACGNCLAKSVCAPGSNEKNIIEVHNKTMEYSIGDSVKIFISKSMGFKAMFLGYLLPFLIVVITLILTTLLGLNELQSGLMSLSVLIPYYFTMYMFREKINEKFVFTLMKLN
jgi:sigma-E factor negative regulatory protein RseC